MGLFDTIWIECRNCDGNLTFQTKSHPDGPSARHDHWDEADDLAKSGARHGRCDCGITATVETRVTSTIVYDGIIKPRFKIER